MKNYIAFIKTQLERTPKAVCMDNGGEYIGMKDIFASKGINPYSRPQNRCNVCNFSLYLLISQQL